MRDQSEVEGSYHRLLPGVDREFAPDVVHVEIYDGFRATENS